MQNPIAKLIALTATLSLAPALAAAETQSFRFRGDSAHAYGHAISGCTVIDVDVFGSVQLSSGGGRPEPAAGTFAMVRGYDFCTHSSMIGFATLDGTFTIDSLQSASASVPLDIYRWDCSEEGCTDGEGQALLSASWIASGDVQRDRDVTLYHDSVFHSVTTFLGAYRPATVELSLVEDGVDLLGGAQTSGVLSRTSSGTHTVTR